MLQETVQLFSEIALSVNLCHVFSVDLLCNVCMLHVVTHLLVKLAVCVVHTYTVLFVVYKSCQARERKQSRDLTCGVAVC